MTRDGKTWDEMTWDEIFWDEMTWVGYTWDEQTVYPALSKIHADIRGGKIDTT